MPAVFAFDAVQYANGAGDVSRFVSLPYDVLDSGRKADLLSHEPMNIVAIDLPHAPAKELGPPEAYANAAETLENWLNEGVLGQLGTPAMFAYRQRFDFQGATHTRCGMACTVETVPLGAREGGGILPHEETFSGPKEDRLALMKATKTQISPIFGMHPDEGGRATSLVRSVMDSRSPDLSCELVETDGTRVEHEVWRIDDAETIAAYSDALSGEDVFIADGHHRYNTAVNYLESLQTGGELPADHPARRTMFVLISMADPGLVIGPTHRVLGGMEHYTPDAFIEAAAGYLQIDPTVNDPRLIEGEMTKVEARNEPHVFGLIDLATGLCWTATTAEPDPLQDRFDKKSDAWRSLDVAVIQHMIVEEVCVPLLNNDTPVRWAFPHSIDEVIALGKGEETGSGGGGQERQQVAIIVRPTPLDTVRQVCLAGELMPQKSTFFFPKLATGLFMHKLA